MRFRFLHAADLHLDTPFQGLARVSPEMADLLRDASLTAFERLVQIAIENEVAFVLLAGDLYDGEQRGVRAQLHFLRGLQALSDRGIKTFIVHGNHDPLGGWSAVREWPPGVKIFGSERVETIPVEIEGRQVATVGGISYARAETTENLALRFPRGLGRGSEEGFRIGLLHCSVGNQSEHSPYSPCSLRDLAEASIDYWALGHVHRATVVAEHQPWAVYPGNTQGRSVKPSERGAKGAVLVEVEDLAVLSLASVPTDSVRFVSLQLDLAELPEGTDLAGVREALVQRALALHGNTGQVALVIRAIMTGRGVQHADLRSPGACDELLRDLRESFVSYSPPLWWESLRDETVPQIDLAVVKARQDFTADLLAQVESMCGDPVALEGLRRQLVPSTRAGLVRRCPPPGDEELRRLLAAAALLALESLEGEGELCE